MTCTLGTIRTTSGAYCRWFDDSLYLRLAPPAPPASAVALDGAKPAGCVLCLDKVANIVVAPCGHLCMCDHCLPSFKTSPVCNKCPMCNRHIDSTLKVYG